MLLQFSVSNYRSFKEKAVLSMEASKDHTHENHVFTLGKNRILQNACVFGANASGKSNLFRALTTAIMLIRLSNQRQVGEPLLAIEPFSFDSNTQKKSSSFEFVFLQHDIKYAYGFSATRERIEEEYLYQYRTSRPAVIFERAFDSEKLEDQYHFTSSEIRKELKPLIEKNTSNKLFLATATSWNSQFTKEPYLWFNRINTYDPNNYEQLLRLEGPLFEKQDEFNGLHDFICRTLREADINVSDFEIKTKNIDTSELLKQLPPPLRIMFPENQMNQPSKLYEINMIHRIQGEDGNIQEYKLPSNQESQGTQNLFFLSPLLKKAFDQGNIVCVDEFDTSLHPMLVVYLIGLFNNPDVNQHHAQLIISTHTTDLLSLKISRRDEIYFVQKEQKTGISELYSLDEFSPRKQADIRNGYYLGRYGAVPEIGDGEVFW